MTHAGRSLRETCLGEGMGVVSSVTLQYALEDESVCKERVPNEVREVWGKE